MSRFLSVGLAILAGLLAVVMGISPVAFAGSPAPAGAPLAGTSACEPITATVSLSAAVAVPACLSLACVETWHVPANGMIGAYFTATDVLVLRNGQPVTTDMPTSGNVVIAVLTTTVPLTGTPVVTYATQLPVSGTAAYSGALGIWTTSPVTASDEITGTRCVGSAAYAVAWTGGFDPLWWVLALAAALVIGRLFGWRLICAAVRTRTGRSLTAMFIAAGLSAVVATATQAAPPQPATPTPTRAVPTATAVVKPTAPVAPTTPVSPTAPTATPVPASPTGCTWFVESGELAVACPGQSARSFKGLLSSERSLLVLEGLQDPAVINVLTRTLEADPGFLVAIATEMSDNTSLADQLVGLLQQDPAFQSKVFLALLNDQVFFDRFVGALKRDPVAMTALAGMVTSPAFTRQITGALQSDPALIGAVTKGVLADSSLPARVEADLKADKAFTVSLQGRPGQPGPAGRSVDIKEWLFAMFLIGALMAAGLFFGVAVALPKMAGAVAGAASQEAHRAAVVHGVPLLGRLGRWIQSWRLPFGRGGGSTPPDEDAAPGDPSRGGPGTTP